MNLLKILNGKNQAKSNMADQKGSIMLEVVAVLALMGVMGSMLFRQIYQRNQELHNIQMASEIRTVKEAFAAYIQAHQTAIIEECALAGADVSDVVKCELLGVAAGVKEYLPDGWFADDEGAVGDTLATSYNFHIFAYKGASGNAVVYGVVVPTISTLPSTGWNFKRAARVALLIGADGGAHDKSITGDDINGSLGSWSLATDGILSASNCDDDSDCPIYVATTGIDIFAPEYEVPEGKVKIPTHWNLAAQNLHAYNHFSVGNSGTGNCYSIGHNTYDPSTSELQQDTITTVLSDTCKPLFWVGNKNGGALPGSGNVYVATDLKVGNISSDQHDEALTLTKEGVIKQKDGLIIDKYGRIFSRDLVYSDIGDLKQGEHFVLDLARTSTMKDIRLASRGGVRLSDILPNYILKEVYDVSCSIEYNQTTGVLNDNNSSREGIDPDTGNKTSFVSWCDAKKLRKTASGNQEYVGPDLNFPDCPTGYTKAVVVIPSFLGSAYTKKGHTHDVNGPSTEDAELNDTGDKFVTDICQSIALVDVGANQHTLGVGPWVVDEPVGDTFRINLGYRNNTGNGSAEASNGQVLSYVCKDATYYGQILHATVQTYCVWYLGLLNQTQCQAAGYKWDSTATPKCTGEPYAEYNMADQSDALEIKKELCECLGFEWGGDSNPRCIYKFIQPSSVKSLKGKRCAFEEWDPTTGRTIGDSEVITICKMLGYDWREGDCKCPVEKTKWTEEYGCQNPDP